MTFDSITLEVEKIKEFMVEKVTAVEEEEKKDNPGKQ